MKETAQTNCLVGIEAYIFPFIQQTGIILGMGLANERRHYYVMPSLNGWANAQDDPQAEVTGKRASPNQGGLRERWADRFRPSYVGSIPG